MEWTSNSTISIQRFFSLKMTETVKLFCFYSKKSITSDSKKMWQLDIVIVTLVWFFSNSYFILQICHAKTFKMRYTKCLYNNIYKNTGKIAFHYSIVRPVVPGCAGCAMAHPDFGRSVNPISIRGTDYAQLTTTGTPGFSDLLTALLWLISYIFPYF